MATQAEIIENAFVRINGGALPNALTNRNGVPIQKVYGTIKRSALLAEEWPWTLARVALTNRDDTVDQPERYRFTMPNAIQVAGTDLVDRRRLGAGPVALYDAMRSKVPSAAVYRLGGIFLYSDLPELWGEFQFDSPETEWPDQFAEYMELRLCASVVSIYKPDEGAAQSQMYRVQAREVRGEVSSATGRVQQGRPMFEHFATTASRFGGGFELEPVALRDGRAV